MALAGSNQAQVMVGTETKSSGLSQFNIYRGFDDVIYAFPNLSANEIISYYQSVAPLAGAIQRLAYAVAGLPIGLYNKQTDERVKDHPVLDLLRYPNADNQKTFRDLLRDLIIWKTLEGDAFLLLTGGLTSPPVELYALNATVMSSQRNNRGFIGQFEYTAQGYSEIYTRASNDKFYNAAGNQELYHIPNFNVNASAGNLDGVSEIAPLYYEINQYVHSAQHNLSLLKNGARPSGAFVLKTKSGEPALLTDEQFSRLKLQIAESYQGASNAGRPLVLEGGLEWVDTSVSPKDMDFETMRSQAEDQIYKTLQIPPQLISSSKVSANNLVNIRREFYQSRVLPAADDILEHFNRVLLPRYRGRDSASKLELRVAREEIDVLTEERAARNKIIEDSTSLTINEKRLKVWNLGPIEHGDKIVDPNGRPIAGNDAGQIVGDTAPAPVDDTAAVKPQPAKKPTAIDEEDNEN